MTKIITLKEKLLTLPQFLLPQHFLSRAMGYLMECRQPFIKDQVINHFIKTYNVNMNEALKPDPKTYETFNAFFTRQLKPSLRPITSERSAIASPVDGTISQLGHIQKDLLLQAKGHYFDLASLLGGDEKRAEAFYQGEFMTLYLAPKDYHRIHMPIAGTLREMVYIPGKLFSVNPRTTRQVKQLFARNERVVCIFDTPHGSMAVILVGAFFVASISTAWSGVVAPQEHQSLQNWQYEDGSIYLDRGDEVGQFKLGSTVIVLFAEKAAQWQQSLQTGQAVRMGQKIGNIVNV